MQASSFRCCFLVLGLLSYRNGGVPDGSLSGVIGPKGDVGEGESAVAWSELEKELQRAAVYYDVNH